MSKQSIRANIPEASFEEIARLRGWRFTKRGWPDFLVEAEDGERIAVEIKPRLPDGRMKTLKASQAETLDWLSSLGVRCFVSDGIHVEPYDRSVHCPTPDVESPAATRRARTPRPGSYGESATAESSRRGVPVWVVHRERCVARKSKQGLMP